ncbi:MAG: signal peptidase I [Clostridiales bacterium]|jgi:signal peptidase|nr:signal peptidase I [Clostridiales bacterium]
MKKPALTQLIPLCIAFFVFITVLVLTSPYKLLAVKSGSMAPALPTHSVIAITKNNQHLFLPGEIITYHTDGRLITHRIIHVGFDGDVYYQTKGDANHSPDSYHVRRPDVYGRVIYVTSPTLSAFISLLYSPKTIRAILILFFILLFPVIFNFHKNIRKLGKET